MKEFNEKQWHLGDIVEDGKGHKAMIVLDEINNPRFLFDGMQQTEIEASRITVLISALKIVRDFVNENLVRVDLED